jgi:hypothetical protein
MSGLMEERKRHHSAAEGQLFDALDFALPTPNELDRAAAMLLKRGYAS